MTISFNRRFVYLLAGVAVMVAAGVLTSALFPAGQRDTFSPPSPSAQAEKTPASSAGLLPSPFRADIPQPKTGWEDRLVYDAYNLYFQDPSAWQPQLRSLDDNGRGERSHPFLCDGEQVLPFPSTARSPDGQTLAFLLPAQELRQSNPNWKQELSEQIFTGKTPASGTIYLYDLDNDICRSLDKSADSLYAQNLAFSPDGRYLAYVFYGLHVYDLRTDQDFYYTVKEGSAAFPEVVLGPISWSQDSTTAYLPVIAFDPPQSETEYRTELVKLNLSQATDINRLEFPQDATDNWAFHSLRGRCHRPKRNLPHQPAGLSPRTIRQSKQPSSHQQHF